MFTFLFICLIIASFMCLYRVLVGPTPPDRMVAIDILGILVIGMCALFAAYEKRDFYLYIAISWSILSFIGTLALVKFLEGRGFDE